MIFPIQCVPLTHSSKPICGPHSPISVTASPPPCCGSAGTLPPSVPRSRRGQLHKIGSHTCLLSSLFCFMAQRSLSPASRGLAHRSAASWTLYIWQSNSHIVPSLACLDSISPFGSELLALSSSLVYTTTPSGIPRRGAGSHLLPLFQLLVSSMVAGLARAHSSWHSIL